MSEDKYANACAEVAMPCPTISTSKCEESIKPEHKAIYLKLVELAKANQVKWLSETEGEIIGSNFRFELARYDCNTIYLYKMQPVEGERYKQSMVVVQFTVKGEQLAGDLWLIAQQQWEIKCSLATGEFLSITPPPVAPPAALGGITWSPDKPQKPE